MKEAYIKPAFYIERFSLTQNIAAGCGYTSGVNVDSKDACSYSEGAPSLFVADGICDQVVGVHDSVVEICYNAPNSSQAIFVTN